MARERTQRTVSGPRVAPTTRGLSSVPLWVGPAPGERRCPAGGSGCDRSCATLGSSAPWSLGPRCAPAAPRLRPRCAPAWRPELRPCSGCGQTAPASCPRGNQVMPGGAFAKLWLYFLRLGEGCAFFPTDLFPGSSWACVEPSPHPVSFPDLLGFHPLLQLDPFPRPDTSLLWSPAWLLLCMHPAEEFPLYRCVAAPPPPNPWGPDRRFPGEADGEIERPVLPPCGGGGNRGLGL